MRPKITVWTQAGCPRCEKIQAFLAAAGYEVTEKDVDNLADEPPDRRSSVMADLQMVDGELPLVYAGDKLVDCKLLEYAEGA